MTYPIPGDTQSLYSQRLPESRFGVSENHVKENAMASFAIDECTCVVGMKMYLVDWGCQMLCSYVF